MSIHSHTALLLPSFLYPRVGGWEEVNQPTGCVQYCGWQVTAGRVKGTVLIWRAVSSCSDNSLA